MTYIKQNWVNGPTGGTPLSAARLNYMEDGIEAAALTGSSGGLGGGSIDATYYDGTAYPTRASLGLDPGQHWWIVNAIDGTVPGDAIEGDIILRMVSP